MSFKRLAAVIALCAVPFILVQLFHPWLYVTMDAKGYLVFHNIAELFSIMVSWSIFGLGWFSYARSNDRHVLFLCVMFLGIGLMDLMHTLGYAGMPDFITPNSTAKTTQYWVAVRLFSAIVFLASGFIDPDTRRPWLSRPVLLPAVLAISGLLFVGVTFFPDRLPATFVEGQGLTPFKIGAEYAVIAILAGACLVYGLRFGKGGGKAVAFQISAFIICIFSELAFTVYKSAYDSFNMLGHLYKVVAFGLIYQGIYVTSINRPYELIRRSLDEKEVLIREIYHRTKNTMQVISGMLVLQAAEYAANHEVQDLVRKTENRIMTMALVHRMLYSSQDLSRIPFRAFVGELVANLQRNHPDLAERITVSVDVEDELVPIDSAVPCGLILNELLSNSFRHGYPHGRGGAIRLAYRIGEGDRRYLDVADDGIGVPAGFDFRSQTSLGLRLVFSIGEEQLLGSVTMRGGKGVSCSLELRSRPLSALT